MFYPASILFLFFFFNDTAPTEIYTLSLHDALPISDAYVSNSFFEGWSVAASEALWLGLPLVLSECGGSRELIGAEGEQIGRHTSELQSQSNLVCRLLLEKKKKKKKKKKQTNKQ